MARIFLSAGYGASKNGTRNSGMLAADTTETREIIQIRDLAIAQLRSRALEVLAVPDDFRSVQTIDWIDTRARIGDVALEIQASAASHASSGGAGVFTSRRTTSGKQMPKC
jgi:hypothetical protein